NEDIVKVQNILKRKKEKSLETNGYWLNSILYSARFNEDFKEITDLEKYNTITSEEIQRVAKKYFNIEEYLQVTLYPEAMKQN
ncbi:MAG: hypothetical protein MI922_06445, partial [Bacteroidales bacterium]|nr:hypothetical protein [Bacteroidales bacterium]